MTPSHHNPPRNAKRKAEDPDDELTFSTSGRPLRKKQKPLNDESISPVTSPTAAKSDSTSALKNHLLLLYRQVENATDDDGRLIATDFLKLPTKKRYPDYYVTIKKPIALDQILDRIEKGEYEDTEMLKTDLTLMTSNAKKYNIKGSSIYEDAAAIQRLVKGFPTEVPQPIKVTLRSIPPKEKPEKQEKQSHMVPVPSKQTLQEAQQELLYHLETLKEPKTKRVYSEIFMDPPSKKEYPEYYAFIQRVISLNEINRNIKKGLYQTWTDFEVDVNLVWSNAMTFNEDGSQVYEDAKILKASFEKALKQKKAVVGEPEPHLKVKLNLSQPSTKIKLFVPQKQPTPPAPSPPTPALSMKKESPVIPHETLPQQAGQARQGSPLKNQITASPSKSPPALRPALPKPVPSIAPQKDLGISVTDWSRQQTAPIIPTHSRAAPVQGLPHPTPQPLAPSRTGVIVPPTEASARQPLHNLLVSTKRERNLNLIPLITISTVAAANSPSSSPSPNLSRLLTITSPPPPAPSTQTLCVTVLGEVSELIFNAFLTKDLTLHGSYTFTVTLNGRKLAPTLWPDASRRSGTTDSISVAAPPGQTPLLTPGAIGDAWQFVLTLGEPGSISTIEASCTAFLKRDERGLLVRGERSRTGQAAGEDGGELERVVILVLRGR